MAAAREDREARRQGGFTLMELMVAVAILAILAAIAIPVFSRYAKEASLVEAAANIQSIFGAQQTYYTRFQRYTGHLDPCPAAAAEPGGDVAWPEGGCSPGWAVLGWRPDKPRVVFQYEVFTLYDDDGLRVNRPTDVLPLPGTWGIDWAAEFPGLDPAEMEPWCAVQAWADTDGDGERVFFRGNSYNQRVYRGDNAGQPPEINRTY